VSQEDIKGIADVIETQEWLTPVADGVQNTVGAIYAAGGPVGPKVKNFLHGTWLGHPLHPVLTDIPVGAWTVAAVLDVVDAVQGNTGKNATADSAVSIGLLGAVGAAVSGLTDYQGSGKQSPRAGVVHGVLNLVATGLYTYSWILRRRGDRVPARYLAWAGYGIMSLSANIGGELVYGQRIGVDHAQRENLPGAWTAVLPVGELQENQLKRAEIDGLKVLLVRRGEKILALGEVCSHLGGPLAEGELHGNCVQCPWHGSRFELDSGKVVDGPSTYPQPKFEARIHNGQVEIKSIRSRPEDSN
jgi:nitrite reductase/ring-hydroxylating ferredoxin subunit/uncharacterized membrane protein